MIQEEAVDLKEVLERVGDDRELLKELFQIYADDFKEKRQQLSIAIQQKDFEKIRNIAHGLKGASGNISAKKLHARFLTLEQMAKGQDLALADGLLVEIDQFFRDLQGFVQNFK